MHEDSNQGLVVESVNGSFEAWANQPFISAETRAKILAADLLIVPIVGFREYNEPVFPVCTEELFHFIRSKLPSGTDVEICIEDKDYKELALHGSMLRIGSFVAKSIVVPILVNLISEYIKQKRTKISKNESQVNVKTDLTIIEVSGKATKFSYDGPSSKFHEVMMAQLFANRQLSDSKKGHLLEDKGAKNEAGDR
jgi:hypothetical protein